MICLLAATGEKKGNRAMEGMDGYNNNKHTKVMER
jgi:hypothetical protein